MRAARKVRIANQELALAFELHTAGVSLEYISEGLGCSYDGLKAAMSRAREYGMYDRSKAPRINRKLNRIVNGIAADQMRGKV